MVVAYLKFKKKTHCTILSVRTMSAIFLELKKYDFIENIIALFYWTVIHSINFQENL